MGRHAEETLEKDTRDRAERAGPRQAVLLLHGARDVEVLRLDPGVPRVVGRAGDVAIDDLSLSRRHARFSLEGDFVEVEDLGSRNGTYFRGGRVRCARLGPGDAVTLGELTVTLSVLTPATPLVAAKLDGADAFFARLEAACASASAFERPFATFYIRSLGGEHATSWLPAVSTALRDSDTLTMHGAVAAFAVLPECSADAARDLAQGIAARADAALAVGVASRGDGPFDRMELARQLAMRADEGYRVPLDEGHPNGSEDVFRSAAMKEVFDLAVSAGRSELPVLVLGETGVGKEVVSRAIHQASRRAERAFCAFSCAAISPALLESELFGHARGAFSGAEDDRPGIFERADGGTLFLDELGELSERAQASLLRALGEGVVRRVGDVTEREVDVRLVAATNADLEARVADGRFRADLWYRVSSVTIEIPPLRQRPGDVEGLVVHFLATDHDVLQVGGALTDAAWAHLTEHSWPGNVRELRNVLARARLLAGDAPHRGRAPAREHRRGRLTDVRSGAQGPDEGLRSEADPRGTATSAGQPQGGGGGASDPAAHARVQDQSARHPARLRRAVKTARTGRNVRFPATHPSENRTIAETAGEGWPRRGRWNDACFSHARSDRADDFASPNRARSRSAASSAWHRCARRPDCPRWLDGRHGSPGWPPRPPSAGSCSR